jgi:hypothetical protein
MSRRRKEHSITGKIIDSVRKKLNSAVTGRLLLINNPMSIIRDKILRSKGYWNIKNGFY